jgi:hypothetical protein
MKTHLLSILALGFFILFLNSKINAQTTDRLKQQKLAEKEKKLKDIKHKAEQEVIVLGYTGGTMAPYGFNFYMMNPEKVGFYGSIRFGKSEIKQTVYEPFKGLVLNLGITKNLTWPIALYVGAGISDYDVFTPRPYNPYSDPKDPNDIYFSDWQFGFDTSFGLIFHVKGFELQGGLSLFNFSKPEFCFGIGYNFLNGLR